MGLSINHIFSALNWVATQPREIYQKHLILEINTHTYIIIYTLYIYIYVCVYIYIYIYIYIVFLGLRHNMYGGSQARDHIRATAAGLHHHHSNAGSEPCLQPTPLSLLTSLPCHPPAPQFLVFWAVHSEQTIWKSTAWENPASKEE